MAKVRNILIYALVDPRCGTKRYIGKSTNGLKRPRQHATPSSRKNDHNPGKLRWLEELAGLGLTYSIVVLEYMIDVESVNAREMWWIAEARRQGAPLLNMTDGGDGHTGAVCTPQTRAKISERAKGRTFSTETRAKISAANSGRARPPEAVRITAEKNRGRKRSPEVIEKSARHHRGKTVSAETRAKLSVASRRRTSTPESRAKASASMLRFLAAQKENQQ